MPKIIEVKAPDGKIVLEEYIPETSSGLTLPQSQGEPRVGIVYAFGNPLERDPKIILKKGMYVCIKKYVSNPLYVPELNKKFIFIDYDDVTAILVEGDNE
jgi:hypothetical protein